MAVIEAVREDPPAKRGGGGARGVNEALLQAMRTVAKNANDWYRIAEYGSRGSASSAANRMRRRNWNEMLGCRGGTWEIVSRSSGDNGAAGVWARRLVGKGR